MHGDDVVVVAERFGVSKTGLLAALNDEGEYEERWKKIQVARAQAAVQNAVAKRVEIAEKLNGFWGMESRGEETTETALTYPRVRELLRIAEHEERSAQWHLERLCRRVYGNVVQVEGLTTPETQEVIGFARELLRERGEKVVQGEVVDKDG